MADYIFNITIAFMQAVISTKVFNSGLYRIFILKYMIEISETILKKSDCLLQFKRCPY